MIEYERTHILSVATQFEPQRYYRLTTLGPVFLLPVGQKEYRRQQYQVCTCDCGNAGVFSVGSMKQGQTKSCGCLREETPRKNRKHGKTGTCEHISWVAIKSRCYNQHNNRYQYYGGRGIKVCDRWLEPDGRGFTNFLEDMGRRPSTKHSIDRIDVNGDYCPENCRWVCHKTQANNKSNNIRIEIDGQTCTLAEWCSKYRMDYTVAWDRIHEYKWEPIKALTTPVRKHKPYKKKSK
jgi:hypothetical protein